MVLVGHFLEFLLGFGLVRRVLFGLGGFGLVIEQDLFRWVNLYFWKWFFGFGGCSSVIFLNSPRTSRKAGSGRTFYPMVKCLACGAYSTAVGLWGVFYS